LYGRPRAAVPFPPADSTKDASIKDPDQEAISSDNRCGAPTHRRSSVEGFDVNQRRPELLGVIRSRADLCRPLKRHRKTLLRPISATPLVRPVTRNKLPDFPMRFMMK